MPTPRSTRTQTVKLAVEVVPGTAPVTGYKELSAMGLTPTINPTVTQFKPAGQKYTTVVALNREDSQWAADGLPTYTEIIYPLSSVFTEPIHTAPGQPVPVAAGTRTMSEGHHWFFKPSPGDADSPLSMTVYKGSAQGAERATFTRFTDFNLTLNKTATALGGTAMGRALEAFQAMPGNAVQKVAVSATAGTFTLSFSGQTTATIPFDATEQQLIDALEALNNIPTGVLGVTKTTISVSAREYLVQFGGSMGEQVIAALTGSATGLTGGTPAVTITAVTAGAAISAVPLIPILSSEVCVYASNTKPTAISATAFEVATNRLTDILEVGFSIGGRYAPYYPLDCTLASFAALVESDPTLQLTTMMQANTQGMAYLNNLRSGGTVYFRIKCVGTFITSVDHYELTIDFAGKVTAASELSDQDSIYAVTWTWDGVPELTGGGPVELAAVNNIVTM
jgi:hypothetical protein